MLDKILSRENMTKAIERIEANDGASGIDGMKASELRSYLTEAWSGLKIKLLSGSYEPSAVRRVEIPKPNGGIRLLGIPTVLDRLLQQAISQEVQGLWESTFSEHSYGFRPKRNTHQAVAKSESYINAGGTYIVDIDLEKFFDRVNHDHLMSLLSLRIKDKCLLHLIGKYLRAGIMIGGVVSQNTVGTPQGSPLSPLLSNIVLDELDKELERRGQKFVRYADDFSIYCTSERGALRVQSSITRYIEEQLHLRVNSSKSGIRRPSKFVLLGFGFYKNKQTWGIRLSPKSISRLKEKIKTLTQRNKPLKTEYRIIPLQQMQTGWLHYFKIADCKAQLEKIDGWTRSRLRMCEWKLWKRVRTRMKRLKSLGASHEQAYQWANTRKGSWRTAHSPILTTTLTNEWLKRAGYVSFMERYKRIRSKMSA
jgi:RNA-directed DNA polymerase